MKSELIEKQLRLYLFLEDPTNQKKLLDSAYAIKNEDNDNNSIKFESVLYEPEVDIKTEPDILEMNQYFSSENIKFNSNFLNLYWLVLLNNQFELQLMKI